MQTDFKLQLVPVDIDGTAVVSDTLVRINQGYDSTAALTQTNQRIPWLNPAMKASAIANTEDVLHETIKAQPVITSEDFSYGVLPYPAIYREALENALSGKRVPYQLWSGGRNGARSWTASLAATLRAVQIMEGDLPNDRILFIRETLRSLKDSSLSVLSDTIQKRMPDEVSRLFTIGKHGIDWENGGAFLFLGASASLGTENTLRSVEGVDTAFCEEAQDLSMSSWQVIRPTVRGENSQIIAYMNPQLPDDPTHLLFAADDTLEPGKDIIRVQSCIWDHPFATLRAKAEMELEKRRTSEEDFNHVYGGQFKTRSHSRVIPGFEVKDLDDLFVACPDKARYGLDWGHSLESGDPTAGVRAFYFFKSDDDQKDREQLYLYISHELYARPALGNLARTIEEALPGVKNGPTRTDQPRDKAMMLRDDYGFSKIMPAWKGPGSIASGLDVLQSCHIILHPRCENTIREFKLYSYPVDKNGIVDPSSNPIDKDNHVADAVRYLLSAGSTSQTLVKPFALDIAIHRLETEGLPIPHVIDNETGKPLTPARTEPERPPELDYPPELQMPPHPGPDATKDQITLWRVGLQSLEQRRKRAGLQPLHKDRYFKEVFKDELVPVKREPRPFFCGYTVSVRWD